jgi:hypothetical protein
MGLKLRNDPRLLHVEMDPDSGRVSAVPRYGDVALGATSLQPLNEFSTNLTRRSFQRLWVERNTQYIQNLSQQAAAAAASPTSGLSFKLPSPLPRQVQSLLGPGGPALNISGSENIQLSGQSNWTNQQLGPQGRKPSLFPSLDMQQNLDIRLEGQLSDRVRVNLLQSSAVQVPLANRIAINYKGEEDDLIQELDLGNTSLSLPGTQYVSYSGKNEGLFGVKSAMRIGALDFSVLASRQEGKSQRASYKGGGTNQTSTIADLDYVKGVYFFLYDPNLDLLDIHNADIQLYEDDYNYSNDLTSTPGRAFVDTSFTLGGTAYTVRGTTITGVQTSYGDTTFGDTASVRGIFTRLYEGPELDYQVLQPYGPSYKIIKLNRQISGEQRLAVTYKAQRLVPGLEGPVQVGGQIKAEADTVKRLYLKLLRAPASIVTPNPGGGGVDPFFDPESLFTRTRDLELKNFYQLPGQRIDPTSFKMVIRQGVQTPAVTSIVSPTGVSIPYIEILGLDSYDQSSGSAVPGHDGVIDGTYLYSGSQQSFIDYENGILFFPDPRPFAPRIGSRYSKYGFDNFVSRAFISRRDSLVGAPATRNASPVQNAANVAIYDNYIVQRSLDSHYFMDLTFTAARAVGEINLGASNILAGSETVTINGQPLVRDRDYTIDYDLGKVVLKRQLGAADQLNVDYSYAPLFQQAARTLLGSAFSLQGRDKSLGGAFMYESQGAQDIRPRLGEEPSRSLIGDLNTAFAFHPDWVTRLVDKLPGVRTTAPSDLNVQAEVGASFPNPNTKNIIYIDDMEGVRDDVALSMDALRWTWGSVPSRKKSDATGLAHDVSFLDDTLANQHNAEIHWYTPQSAVKEGDLKPNLTDAEGAQTAHSSLMLSIPRRPLSAKNAGGIEDTLWSSLTYPLDPVGLDLSRSQFIEVWVNDFRDRSVRDPSGANRGMKLHIDLGVVSEDQMRSPDVPPNNKLDTEDTENPPDHRLDVTGARNEDTGLDGKLDAEEIAAGTPIRDLMTATSQDPDGDDYPDPPPVIDPNSMDPAPYRPLNGTENNHKVNPNPDTEDLNLDNVLQTQNSIYEYTIALCDTCKQYLVTDVYKEFSTGVPHPPMANNGWRRYRIPIADTLRTQFGTPDLTLARDVRIWLEGVLEPDPPDQKRPLLALGGIDVVGSRWQATALTDSQSTEGTTLTISSLNTVDNADEYHAPFDPGTDRTGAQAVTRREQSLSLEFENLMPEDTLEIFRTFSIDEDYSRYGNLDWFVSGLKVPAADFARGSFDYFVRFASDEQGFNYYEFKAPVPSNAEPLQWDEIKIALTALSNLKLAKDFPITDPILYKVAGPRAGDSLTVAGHPSFTRLRRISFGIINQSTDPRAVIHSGKVLLDEMTATDIAKDPGYAERVLVNGHMANLVGYNFTWNGRDANFQSVGETRGSGNTSNQIAAGANVDLHRFIEGTGIVLPVSYGYSRNSSKPRFTAGDDVIRTGALEDASESLQETKSFSTSYSRQWSDRSNPLLRYTLGGITATYSRNQSDSKDPNSVGSSISQGAGVNYGIAPRDFMIIPIPLTNKVKFYPLPERFFWNYSVSTSDQKIFDRTRDATGLVLRNDVVGRTGFINFGADTRPFDFFHHHFEAVRNLTLPQREQIGFINLGKVVTWRQNMDARYTVNHGPWLSPTFGWSGNYAQDNRPELSSDLSVRALANGQSLTAGWTLPFDRWAPQGSRVRAFGDTSRVQVHRASRPSLRSLLSRLGGITTEANYNQTSAYSRLVGTTDFWYLAGLSDNPGLKPNETGRMRDTTGNTIQKSQDWRANVHTRLALPYDVSVTFRGEYNWRRNEQNGVASSTGTSQFPNLDLDYGRMLSTLQFDRFMNSPRLRTSYSRSKITEYRGGGDSPTSIGTSSQWQPLFGLTGEFKNQTRVEFKVERRVTVRQDFSFGSSTRTDRNTDINLSLNRAYSRGQKVKFLGKETTIKSSVQLGLTGSYSRVSGESTRQGSGQDQLRTDQDRLSLNGTGSYSFSNNVTGSLSLGFGQNRDMVLAVVSRDIRVELRAAFTF